MKQAETETKSNKVKVCFIYPSSRFQKTCQDVNLSCAGCLFPGCHGEREHLDLRLPGTKTPTRRR